MKHSKISSKVALLVSLLTFLIAVVLFLSNFAIAEEVNPKDDESFTVSGHVVDKDNVGISNVLVSGWFFVNDVAVITEDVNTTEDGSFAILNVPKGSTGCIRFYPSSSDDKHSGVNFYVYNEIAAQTDIGTVTLPTLTNKVSGKVTDSKGNGIPNVTLEFYNASSIKSPNPDIYITTKQDGTYNLRDAIYEPTTCYSGVSIGCDYYVVAQTYICEQSYISKTKDIHIQEGDNTLDFQLDRVVNINLYDYNKTKNGWAEWFHQVYINGQLQDEGGYLGDPNLTIPLNTRLTVKENCTLELSYSITFNNATDNYIETFTPAFRIAKDWEPVAIDENLVGDYLLIEFNETVVYKCHEGYTVTLDETINNVSLNVLFKEKPIEPDTPEINPSANLANQSMTQTGDSNWILFAIIGAILLLSIAGLITYYVMKKKNSKKINYKPKH